MPLSRLIYRQKERLIMSENRISDSALPDKQVKRLRNLISEAETNLAAARELLNSMLGPEDMPSRTHRIHGRARRRGRL